MIKIYSRFSLLKRMVTYKKYTRRLASSFSEDLIMPYAEKSAEENRTVKDGKVINAHDLFSMFTADIIKKDTVFVR